jgi:hypothetical protein
VRIVVNGRFLLGPPTGIHRVGRGLVDGARAAGIPFEVVAPNDTDDPRADRRTWRPPGRFGEHLWEQVVLPGASRGRPIISLANTAPLAAKRFATRSRTASARRRRRPSRARGAASGSTPRTSFASAGRILARM